MTDIVNGTVIGDVTTDLYITFHNRSTGEQVILGNWYPDETSAIEYVRRDWPSLYQTGLEMRIHA